MAGFVGLHAWSQSGIAGVRFRQFLRSGVATGALLLGTAALSPPATAATIHIAPGSYPNGVNISNGQDVVVDAGSLTTQDGETVIHGSGRVLSFVNNATVTRGAPGAVFDRQALFSSGGITYFENNGTMEGLGPLGSGVIIDGTAPDGTKDTFINNGTILGAGAFGVLLNGPHGAFSTVASHNYRFTNTGTISGYYGGLRIDGNNTSEFNNYGTIVALAADAAAVEVSNGVLVNSTSAAVIRGDIGIVSHAYFPGRLEILNAGLIEGTKGMAINFAFVELDPGNPNFGRPEVARNDILVLEGTSRVNGAIKFGMGNDLMYLRRTATVNGAVDFGPGDDFLELQTGARLNGAAEFGSGTDTLDVYNYVGSLLLPVSNLESVTLSDGATRDYTTFTSVQLGTNLYSRSGGNFAIANIAPIVGGGGWGRMNATVTAQITTIVSDQLSDLGGGSVPGFDASRQSNASAYAPTALETDAEAAVLTALAVTPELPKKAWVTGFGGGSVNNVGTPLFTVFGGIVAGTHAQVQPKTTAGLLVGYVQSRLDSGGGGQIIATQTGLAGVYARSDVGVVRLDASLIGGVNSHHSTRTVVTGLGTETAVADYLSWFLAPEVAASVPVLTTEKGELNVAVKVQYAGGAVAGYTETGSSLNLTVGTQTIGLIDVRTELNGQVTVATNEFGKIDLFGKLGVFAQSNVGGSTVPVTLLGNTFSIANPGGIDYGAYAGAGVNVPLNATTDLTASISGSVRNDGLVSGAGKLQVTGSY